MVYKKPPELPNYVQDLPDEMPGMWRVYWRHGTLKMNMTHFYPTLELAEKAIKSFVSGGGEIISLCVISVERKDQVLSQIIDGCSEGQ